ncbi:AcrR family transcriptional regulator [Parabacteroides sp. PFB2-10]|uniref:TetR/AcrR family transcriptional regulator n=1 Tax=Parabacteroides sp. PFB2-10 TaxID=1742405 RepID=UPI002475412D|nr:TetR/AcrR family transcriptional regulator [Parabacteroides sp. PFB2-10]MDH6311273.1 AcrR family transcriptional regulator [Parabacteroides sp. PFB2-10]MDL2245477.1 TetR/AcrR family transcriptional regulator [Parabacteroides sp. OttesenSCG-928-J18]
MAGKRIHKREDLIRAGWRMMQKYGIRRVTVEDICKEAGSSKMTFYKYFENKMELIKNMLWFYADENLRDFREIMAMDIPFNQKMERTVYMKLDKTKEISADFVRDIYQSDNEEMRTFMQAFYADAIQRGVEELTAAQERGEMRPDINPILLVVIFDALKMMISDERLLNAYPSMRAMIEDISRFFVYGVSNYE